MVLIKPALSSLLSQPLSPGTLHHMYVAVWKQKMQYVTFCPAYLTCIHSQDFIIIFYIITYITISNPYSSSSSLSSSSSSSSSSSFSLETGFLCVALAIWNSLCRPPGPQTQRSPSLCLLSHGIKVMCHPCLARNFFF